MPAVITGTSEGDDLNGRCRQGVNRPDDAPAGQRKRASVVPPLARPRPLVVTGNPCASRMIPLESPVDLQQVAFHLKEDDRPGRGGTDRSA